MLLLGCCLLTIEAFAQVRGQVINAEDGKPIPFATVHWGSNNGGYTNETGKFEVAEEAVGKGLIISCVGFKTDTFNTQNSRFTEFKLFPDRIQMKSITISDRPSKPIRLGAPKKRKGVSSWRGEFGQQHAIYIPGDSLGRTFLIKEALYQANNFFAEIKASQSFFRLHLYSKGSDGFPNKELLKANLIVYPKKNGGWQTVDLSRFSILFPPEGLFLAMEWLGNSPTKEYKVTMDGKKKIRTAIGHSLNMHKTKNHFYEHVFYYPDRGWRDMSDNPYPDNENYIPCLALEVVEI